VVASLIFRAQGLAARTFFQELLLFIILEQFFFEKITVILVRLLEALAAKGKRTVFAHDG